MDVKTVCVEHKGINESGELEKSYLTKCEDAECINWFVVEQGDTKTRSCGDCCTEYLDENYDYNGNKFYWEHHAE